MMAANLHASNFQDSIVHIAHPFERMGHDILELNKLIDGEVFPARSKEIMEQTLKLFKEEDQYLPWVRYLDVAHKFMSHKKKFSKEEEIQIEEIWKFLIENFPENKKIDWRIARKLFEMRKLHANSPPLTENEKKYLLQPFKHQLKEALDHLDWAAKPNILAEETITQLLRLLDLEEEDVQSDFITALITGRFDKRVFGGLKNTIIVGEDGGLYMMLNRIDEKNRSCIEKIVGEDYLEEKAIQDHESVLKGPKVVIGKGAFGKVRFALNLLHGIKNPGDLICVKKTNSFQEISNRSLKVPIVEITKNTLNDYFTDTTAKVIYAPKIVDMAIVSAQQLQPELSSRPKKNLEGCHKKGYVMMEIFPQNTGKKMFNPGNNEITEFQKWEHQKPYLLDVLRGVNKLLEKGVAMTDLKPENTLYDKDLRKATIIDLGGTAKSNDLSNFNPQEERFDFTKDYAAPELTGREIIDLNKAMAFSCGKIIENTTTFTDYPELQDLLTLVERLTQYAPNDRLPIKEAIEEIQQMGNDNYKEHIIFTDYINKVKNRLNSNRYSSIGLNEDLKETQDLLIPLEVTPFDPGKYGNLMCFSIDEKMEDFLKNDEKRVFLLLGAAGAGKSITLQLTFIDAIMKWNPGDPLPIYFNLANGIHIENILERLNQELKTGLSIERNLKGKRVNLYVDSFDEGFYSNQEKTKLILTYQNLFGKEQTKIIVSCRSDYPIQDDWFTNAMDKYYVALFEFEDEDEEILEIQILKYTKKQTPDDKTIGYFKRRIKDSGLLINTRFLFHLVMKTLPSLEDSKIITKEQVYHHYIQIQKDQIFKNYTEKQKQKVNKKFSEIQLEDWCQELATILHIDRKFRIDQDSKLFWDTLCYDPRREFHYQLAAFILQLLPLKIEVHKFEQENGKYRETITVGFRHEIIKNYYLAKAIFKENADSKILSSYHLNEDVELVRYLVEVVQASEGCRKKLLEAIFATRNDKSSSAITCAANAITILVAARHCFSKEDLSNVSLKGANISNGIFHMTDFTNADLTDVVLKNAYLCEAIFKSTIMTNVMLGVIPDLIEDSLATAFICAAYSPTGENLAIAVDRSITIWEVSSNQKLKVFPEVHKDFINSIAYSQIGNILGSASTDKTVIIQSVFSEEIFLTLDKFTEEISTITFSPDARKILIALLNHVEIFEVISGQIWATLQESFVVDFAFPSDDHFLFTVSRTHVRTWNLISRESTHSFEISSYLSKNAIVAISSDQRFIAAADLGGETARIWEITSGKEMQELYQKEGIERLRFSPDARYLAAKSDEMIQIWDVNAIQIVQTIHFELLAVLDFAFSPDGKTFAMIDCDGNAKILETTFSKELQILNGLRDDFCSIAFSQEENVVTTVSRSETDFNSFAVQIWDAVSGKELRSFEETPYSEVRVVFSQDGKNLLASVSDKSVQFTDLNSGQVLKRFSIGENQVNSLACSPNGHLIAIEKRKGFISIWDSINEQKLITFTERHEKKISCMAFSFDSTILATGSTNVELWNVTTGKKIQMLKGVEPFALAFTFDDRILIAVSITVIRLWKHESGEQPRILKGDFETACFLEKDILATGSKKGYIQIWNVSSGESLQNFRGHIQEMIHMVYYPKNKILLTCDLWDKTVKIWKQIFEEGIQTSQNQFGKFILLHNLSRFPNLMADKMIIDEPINLSNIYLKVFRQRGCVIQNKSTTNETNKE